MILITPQSGEFVSESASPSLQENSDENDLVLFQKELGKMRPTIIRLALAVLAVAAGIVLTVTDVPAASLSIAVGPQYNTTHVYVAPEDFDRFIDALVATFGGTKSKRA